MADAPVPAIFWKTVVDTSIRGYLVPADTMVVVAAWLNHYWPGLWTDPNTFDPERFSEARRENSRSERASQCSSVGSTTRTSRPVEP